MRLFIKHIFRSMLKNPIQPLIIILVIALSTAASVISIRLPIKLNVDRREREGTYNYVSDISIRLSSRDDVRIMLGEDANEIIGDGGEVIGEFRLTGVIGGGENTDLIGISATDLYLADRFFSFKFTDYGSFTEENLKRSAVISVPVAEKYGLSVGDTVSVKIAGQTFDMTVEAIAHAEGLLGECGIVIDISAIRAHLAEDSPIISSLDDSFKPYTNLRIKIHDKTKIDEYIELLSLDPRFSDKVISNDFEEGSVESYFDIINLVSMIFAAVVILILSLFVILTSLMLLNRQRRSDSALFAISGAGKRELGAFRVAECFILGFFGFLLSILPLSWMQGKMNELYGWEKNLMRLETADVVIAFLVSAGLVTLTSFIYVFKSRNETITELLSEDESEKDKKTSRNALIITSAMLVSAIAVMLAVAPMSKYIPGFVSLPVLVLFISFATDFLIKLIMRGASALSRMKRPPALIYLSAKSIVRSYGKRHVGKLMTVLLTMVIGLSLVLRVSEEQIDVLDGMVDCDKMVLGADAITHESIGECDEVEDAFRMCLLNDMTLHGDVNCIAFAIYPEAVAYIADDILPNELPEAGCVAVSSGIASQKSLKVGDSLELENHGERTLCTVSEIIGTGINIIVVNPDEFSDGEVLCVKLKDGVDADDALFAISTEAEERGAVVVDRSYMIDPVLNTIDEYVILLRYALMLALGISIVGIFNIVEAEIFRGKNDRTALFASGMSRRGVIASEAVTVLTTLLISLVLAIPFGLLMFLLSDYAMISFGIDFIY